MTVLAPPAGADQGGGGSVVGRVGRRIAHWYRYPPDAGTGSVSAAASAFRGRPWSLAALVAALVVIAGVVFGWNIGYRGYPVFYSDAARSMSMSWRAFFFGSFDPDATVTLDKLAGFLVPQALSARIFGFHPWSLALPQVIEGMITVLASYVIGARWKSPACGLLAAGMAMSTPLLAALFGRGSEDALLTMSLTMAFLCWQSAVVNGRLRPLLLVAVWVAIGFQAKMMQAWLIVPGLAIGYLVAAPNPLRQRIQRSVLAGALLVVLSLSWLTAIQFVPPSHRPYIDGTTDNNMYTMVFGYNGFNRVIPGLIPGAVAPAAPVTGGAPAEGLIVAAESSPAKLVLPFFTTQIGWWYPLALAGIILGLWPMLRRRSVGGAAVVSVATSLALTVWLLTGVAFLSLVDIPHTAYLAAISVQIALLAAAGLWQAIKLRAAGSAAARSVLPLLIGAQTGWTCLVLLTNGVAPIAVPAAVAVLGIGALVVLVRGTTATTGRTGVGLAIGLVGILLAPTLWTGSLITRSDTIRADPYAGPTPGLGTGTARYASTSPTERSFEIEPPFRLPPDPRLSRAQANLVAYIRAHPGTHGPTMATDRWAAAEPYIELAGLEVVAFGGFSVELDTPTLGQLETLVSTGRLTFALLHAARATDRRTPAGLEIAGGGFGLFEGNHALELRSWIFANCVAVPASDYTGPHDQLAGQQLYSCADRRR